MSYREQVIKCDTNLNRITCAPSKDLVFAMSNQICHCLYGKDAELPIEYIPQSDPTLRVRMLIEVQWFSCLFLSRSGS